MNVLSGFVRLIQRDAIFVIKGAQYIDFCNHGRLINKKMVNDDGGDMAYNIAFALSQGRLMHGLERIHSFISRLVRLACTQMHLGEVATGR